jgi:hypothetical protein
MGGWNLGFASARRVNMIPLVLDTSTSISAAQGMSVARACSKEKE